MKVIYRISDGGNNKNRPSYVTKKNCLLNFLKTFSDCDIYIVADNVKEETYLFLQQYMPKEKIIKTSLGNSKSFIFIMEYAITHFNSNETVYFGEDDYLYTPKALEILTEGLKISDYVTGYDHPDKYSNHQHVNPLVRDGGENTRVLLTKNSHWKYTNSTCMTFGANISILKEDYDVFKEGCSHGNIPHDFGLWQFLINNKNRKLISPLPGVCTHGETIYLSPLIDWENTIVSDDLDL
jgi:hypothetical protein